MKILDEEDDYVEVDVHLHAVSIKALRVSTDGDDDSAEWIPKSLCDLSEGDYASTDIGITVELRVAEWKATQAGLI